MGYLLIYTYIYYTRYSAFPNAYFVTHIMIQPDLKNPKH